MNEQDFYELAEKRCNATGPNEPGGWYIRVRAGSSRGVSRTPDGETGRDVPSPVTEPQLRAICEELITLHLQRERLFVELLPAKGGRVVAAFAVEPEDGMVAPATRDDFLGAFVETLKLQRLTINDQSLQINKLFDRLLKSAQEEGFVAGLMQGNGGPKVTPEMQKEIVSTIKDLFGNRLETPGDAITAMDKLVSKMAEKSTKDGKVTLSPDERNRAQAILSRIFDLVGTPEGAS